jgi:hypothetical protein
MVSIPLLARRPRGRADSPQALDDGVSAQKMKVADFGGVSNLVNGFLQIARLTAATGN